MSKEKSFSNVKEHDRKLPSGSLSIQKTKSFFDLRSSGLLGRKPIIGTMMFIIGSLIFALLAYNLVNDGPLIKLDLFVNDWFHAIALQSSPLVINIMIAGYYIGKEGIILIGIILALYFLHKRFWRELLMVIVGFCGAGLLFIFFSHIFMRSRPFLQFDKPLWASPNIPGFPSGHTLSIVVCFGFLIYLLMPKIKSKFGKFLLITFSLLIMLFVGFSRLYLGDHYLTDILAGYTLGFAWFGTSFTFVELLYKKYQKN